MQLRWPRVNTQYRLLSLSAWVFLRLTFVCVCAYECVCARAHICTVSDHLELELLSVLHHQHGCWELTFSLMQELAEPGAHPSSRLYDQETTEIYSCLCPSTGTAGACLLTAAAEMLNCCVCVVEWNCSHGLCVCGVEQNCSAAVSWVNM